MIPYRAMWSNLDFANNVLGKIVKPGDNVISILPMAHMYGMAFEFIFEFMTGIHIFFLTRMRFSGNYCSSIGRCKANSHDNGSIGY